MSSDETKRLLRNFRIVPNKLLGQNFLVEESLYSKLCEYAMLSKDDVVVDVGAGFGFLTRFLAKKCKAVIAVEKDSRLAVVLREQVKGYDNISVVEGDILGTKLPEFDKVVAIPPYYLSSRLISWLLELKTKCSVLILQREFADKLVAVAGSENYGWLAVVASREMNVELLDAVPNFLFYPQPEVDSVVVRLTYKAEPIFKVKNEVFFKQMVRWLFTKRNKKIRTALAPFLRTICKLNKQEAKDRASKAPFGDKRARELYQREFGDLTDAIGS